MSLTITTVFFQLKLLINRLKAHAILFFLSPIH